MKILVVSNLYPPHHQGGYELRCQQVAEYLHRQGHDVRVVTSSYRIAGTNDSTVIDEGEVNQIPVARLLRHHRLETRRWSRRMENLKVVKRQFHDARRFGAILDDFKPDVVSWWNLEGITKIPLGMSMSRSIPAVHCIDDNWMIREFGAAGDVDLPFWFGFWSVQWGPRPLRSIVRMCLAPVERRVQRHRIPTRIFGVPASHVCFISEFWEVLHEQAGLMAQSSEVIYGGVSPEKFFAQRTPTEYADGPLKLLYAGFVDQRRGLHTIIEALGLVPARQRDGMQLSVAYPGPVGADPYFDDIKARIHDLHLSKSVTFLPRIPHEQMPAVYAGHHVLVFASMRNEGMPMVMMEAMCAGCAVITTGSGGSIELAERARSPLFPKDHPFALSRLLSKLERDRRCVAEIALRGQDTVLREFTLDQMLQKTSRALMSAANAS